jgi:septum formation protein
VEGAGKGHSQYDQVTSDPARPALLLASGSARRRKILADLGAACDVAVPGVDEVHHVDNPRLSAMENAGHKLQWALERFAGRRIVAADTVIDLDGRCIGKPESLDEAVAMFLAFSGRPHTVLTAVGLGEEDGRSRVQAVQSTVVFRHLERSTALEYFRLVNPFDKAGAYDIDQRGEMIVESYSGSFTNIMGLPAELIRAWLGERSG